MDPKSEVLLRQYDFLSGRILLINAPTDDLLAEFDASINPAVWTWN
ncbi:16S rRNA methyltransferase, partial [Salmonella enterica subsp. enterica serovar Enteritidis]|nr:16S rRNA methyltransferase [Salmonella enterica subsp. enterica serovar Enteritidis]